MYFITWVLITGTSLTYPSGDGTALQTKAVPGSGPGDSGPAYQT